MLWPVGALSATQAPLISVACMTHHTCMTHPLTQACVDQGEVVMMGEQYQPDVLHPAWAPGAVAPLPSFLTGLCSITCSTAAGRATPTSSRPPSRGCVLAELGWRFGRQDGRGRRHIMSAACEPCPAKAVPPLGPGGPAASATQAVLPLLQMDPVPFRARSWLDTSPDLQQPQVGSMDRKSVG